MDILILFGMVIGLMLIGVPIAVSLGLSSIIFLFMHSEASLASVAQTLFRPLRDTTRCWRSLSSFSPPALCPPVA